MAAGIVPNTLFRTRHFGAESSAPKCGDTSEIRVRRLTQVSNCQKDEFCQFGTIPVEIDRTKPTVMSHERESDETTPRFG